MPFDRHLEGRLEKRLPIAVVVCLTGANHSNGAGQEETYTDNVSLHGVRLISRHPWHPGEVAQVTPVKYGILARGKVVYCKQLANDRYFVGLNFPQQTVRWSSFTYPGMW